MPGREHRITSSALLRHPKEQGLVALDSTGRKEHSSKKKRGSRSSDGRKAEKGTGRRIRSSEEELQSGIQSPISARREGSQEARDRRRSRRRKRGTRSLPRDALRNYDSDTERGTARGRRREKKKGRRKSRSEERVRKAEGEENKQENEQEEAAVEEGVEEKKEDEPEEVVNLERGEEEENKEEVFLPVPNPNLKLPRPKQMWGVENDESWDMAAEYRELRREEEQEWSGDEGGGVSETELNDDQTDDEARIGRIKRPLPSFAAMDASQSELFSFLTSSPSVGQPEDDESDSGDSQSEAMSAASISGLSLAATEAGGRRAELLPGPWLRPGRQRAARVTEGRSRPGLRTEEGGGGSTAS